MTRGPLARGLLADVPRATHHSTPRRVVFNRKARIKRRMLAQALKDVNTIRAEWMLPPIDALPEGTRSSSHCCVNANALRMGSDIAYVSVNADKIRYALQPDDPWKSLTTTPAMRWLVKELDQGNLPELEEDPVLPRYIPIGDITPATETTYASQEEVLI
jgi:hypothetical protein